MNEVPGPVLFFAVLVGVAFVLVQTTVFSGDSHEDWIMIRDSNDPEKFRRFQKKYPDSIFEPFLKVKLWHAEKDLWEKKLDTFEKCRNFIVENGEKPAFRKLIYLVMRRADKLRFKEIKESPSIEKVRRYLRTMYVNGDVSDGYNLLMRLDYEKKFGNMQTVTKESLRKYLNRYKNVISRNLCGINDDYFNKVRKLYENAMVTGVKTIEVPDDNGYINPESPSDYE